MSGGSRSRPASSLNYNGITGTQQDRPDSTPPAHLLDDFHVHDNLICATHGEHPVGVVADMGSPCCPEHGRTTWRCY